MTSSLREEKSELSRGVDDVLSPLAGTDLHAAIMRLPCKVPSGYPFGSELCAGVYKQGHRDARHAAAELALAADAVRAELLATLKAAEKEVACRMSNALIRRVYTAISKAEST